MAKLIVTTDDQRWEVEVLPLTTVGRHLDATIPLLDELVSKHHCQIIALDGGRFVLRDCQSRNGTWLRGARVAERELQDGDEFIVGKAVIRLVGAPPPSTSAPAVPVPETAKSIAPLPEIDVDVPAPPGDPLAVVRRIEDSCARLQVRFNELGALVAVMSNRSSTIDKRSRIVDDTIARMGEALLQQERAARELWGEAGRLAESLEGHEQRLQELAREQAELRRLVASLSPAAAPERLAIATGRNEPVDAMRRLGRVG